MNRLYYGDCLTVMQEMSLGSVDLIYLDPPFQSNRDYNAIYQDETGRPLPDQIEAFCDTWTLDADRERAIRAMPVLMREHGIEDEIAEFWRLWMNALRKTNPRLLAYLSYMVQRLLPMRGLLKPTGSLYLHCDPTASHYIKVMLDGLFGHENFRNEIVWRRTGAHGRAKRWGPIHDTLLFYSRGKKYTWNRVFEAYDPEYIENFYRFKDDHDRYRLVTLDGPGTRKGDSGQPWRGVNPTDKGRHWELPPDRALPDWFDFPEGYSGMTIQERLDVLDAAGLIYWPPRGSVPQYKRYLSVSAGNPVQDIVSDIRPIGSQAKERLGYNTQKPIELLERIIAASSNPGDVVFDPFCGCATTLEAAHRLGRRWIGIDIAIHAIKRVAKIRLEERLKLVEGTDFTIDGVPRNLEGARDLWTRDKYHFQKWAVEEVDGFVTTRRGSDGGIDGRLYFAMPQTSPTARDPLRSMVIEVKGGKNVGIGVVRDLRGVLEREEAEMAGLIVMDDPGPRKRANFEREMAAAGDLDVFGTLYPRMQLLTVEEIIGGARFNTPGAVGKGAGQAALAV
ncbi:MAG: DNA methyltransferase [Rhodospirillaceae bacterium]|nr:DNA methyltransferase [Rhodospirillaceae bacterium]MDE0616403.1 DNA methyltransferase [Rhodospirillaceae bacterium]